MAALSQPDSQAIADRWLLMFSTVVAAILCAVFYATQMAGSNAAMRIYWLLSFAFIGLIFPASRSSTIAFLLAEVMLVIGPISAHAGDEPSLALPLLLAPILIALLRPVALKWRLRRRGQR